METDDWRLSLKAQREEIEQEVQDRLSFLKEEREQRSRESRTGWYVAVFCLCAGLMAMYFDSHLVAIALIVLSVMGYIGSKFDELKSEIARMKLEQVSFSERFVRHELTIVSNDIARMRYQAKA